MRNARPAGSWPPDKPSKFAQNTAPPAQAVPLELLELEDELELLEELELELDEDEELLVLDELLLDELLDELELVDELLELLELDDDDEELEVWPPQAVNSSARQVMARGLFI